jgi:Xaa-Pro aminopeptidase
MFQSFDAPPASVGTADRVKRLRALMTERGLSAWLVPRADEHQGEYVPPSAERLSWLTGFTGSAGMAIIARRSAALFVDGRYTVQSRQQVDTSTFEILQVPEAKVSDWLSSKLARGAVVGFDPRLHTIAETEQRRLDLAPKGIKLRAVRANLVDRVWGASRPKPPAGLVTPQPMTFAGRTAEDKIAALQRELSDSGQDAVLLTLPDSIAWLLNIRGRDVAHNPVALAFAVVPRSGRPRLFINGDKIGQEAARHLARLVDVASPSALAAELKKLKHEKAKVRVDPATAGFVFASALGGTKRIVRAKDPCIDAKAVKNAIEIAGARAAHERDGAAMVAFLAWLDRAAMQKGGLTEIAAVEKLEAFRQATGALEEISFDTISGSGPNGAIVHYRVSQASDRKLGRGELFLVDSGAQYRDGTTDITRTVTISRPTAEMRERYTLVLKGHIAIATARFPKGSRGVDIDAFARRALWDKGLDYDHGTGHGVGSYLSVHEGPASISKRGMAVLEPGMILSNEPGYYKEGAYGIRIENLVLVTPAETIGGGDRPMLGFETLTLCPYDRHLIDVGLLAPMERSFVDAYHTRVRRTLISKVAAEHRAWLEAATAPL